jgi:membrane-bound lytic murein transglycosylase D
MASSGSPNQAADLGTKKIYHKVRKGETLASIAKKYDIEVSALKEWNRISSKKGKLKKGQRLTIYEAAPLLAQKMDKKTSKPESGSKNKATASDSIKVETVQAINVSANEPAKPYVAKEQVEKGSVIRYTVKKNDNLWTIAKRYSKSKQPTFAERSKSWTSTQNHNRLSGNPRFFYFQHQNKLKIDLLYLLPF